jgi:hypothetical protein
MLRSRNGRLSTGGSASVMKELFDWVGCGAGFALSAG